MGHRYKLDTNGCIGPLMAFEHISAPQTYILEQKLCHLDYGRDRERRSKKVFIMVTESVR